MPEDCPLSRPPPRWRPWCRSWQTQADRSPSPGRATAGGSPLGSSFVPASGGPDTPEIRVSNAGPTQSSSYGSRENDRSPPDEIRVARGLPHAVPFDALARRLGHDLAPTERLDMSRPGGPLLHHQVL